MKIVKLVRSRIDQRIRIAVLTALVVIGAGVLFRSPPLPLRADYHQFSDKRRMFGIPNCLDVLSNIPFMVVGLWGVLWVRRERCSAAFVTPRESIAYLIFFAGVLFTGLGSFWYHLAPDNDRLPWDLLPMTFSYMSMLSATVTERISEKVGVRCHIPLICLGIASVVYWQMTEMHGHGDYRFYLFVQFFPPLLIAATIVLFPARYSGLRYLVIAFAFFVLAKLFESSDGAIYTFTGRVSGHSLKHATAGIACYWVLLMLKRRKAITKNAVCWLQPRMTE